ncbi:hypothetical protein [Cereibacter sphaeroides]|mgnify:CR=1 FL=1|uniref:Uncharacterized protein n=2 Tax=Cereibacter sphaeroides TaxID=1063 RepID=Q3J5Z5_CERS4|nr:hypothetical protein [Cereibacter sphaeroides]ABA77789.1 hypothetical protein RSP_1644 [Cereibacter sphaeroides 2.4.1]AMJ46183.1 hypothetical protein APX01_01110 [Cereibacter sphaeroides]ANS32895.1 hypothetical protein A3858_01110 [Cereibacter sphaeroides]ATN61947.1 hypothetical protein A3857_01110 [Cereibacter sphaeroides]AXC60030.1 hypothetical protein DQL45_01165 [Cereibacter sphaeroides 2.4.1]
MKTIVTFIRPWNRYNRGETAGFDPATAAGLIGVHAVPYRPAEGAPAAIPAAAPAPAPAEPAPSFETAMAALETPAETAPAAAAPGTADLPVQGRRK